MHIFCLELHAILITRVLVGSKKKNVNVAKKKKPERTRSKTQLKRLEPTHEYRFFLNFNQTDVPKNAHAQECA